MKVKCFDGIVLELEDALVYASSTVKQLIEEKIPCRRCFGVWIFDGKDENYEISFEKEISSKTLLMINEYVKKHADAASTSSNRISRSLRSWDLEFIKVDRHTLFALVLVSFFFSFFLSFFSHVILTFYM
jgi:hypothetical protein